MVFIGNGGGEFGGRGYVSAYDADTGKLVLALLPHPRRPERSRTARRPTTSWPRWSNPRGSAALRTGRRGGGHGVELHRLRPELDQLYIWPPATASPGTA